MGQKKGEFDSEGALRKLDVLLSDMNRAQRERDIKVGRKHELLETLKRDFGISSEEEAEDRVKQLGKIIERRTVSLSRSFDSLVVKYGLDE